MTLWDIKAFPFNLNDITSTIYLIKMENGSAL